MFEIRTLPVRITATIILVPKICKATVEAVKHDLKDFKDDVRAEIDDRMYLIDIMTP